MAVYRHADGGEYRRVIPHEVRSLDARVYWIPDEEEPIGRGGEVVLYLPWDGEMPADLAAQGFECYATPISRWLRRFEDVTPPFAEVLAQVQALFAEGWTPGPCIVEGCEVERDRPFTACMRHTLDMVD